jgi:hypothetical protein
MGSFKNFEIYYPIPIADSRFNASTTTKEKGRLINERSVWEVSKISKLTIRS